MEKTFINKISNVLFRTPQTELDIHQKTYYKCLQASRRTEFYTEFEVADTFDGRFDMLCLIICIFMQRLSQESDRTKIFNQLLFDTMFKDMDLTLREMGAGDLGVGKRVKIMSESFMGRLTKYSKSMENNDVSLLADTLSRNLYRQDGTITKDSSITKLVLKIYHKIANLEIAHVMSEEFDLNDLISTCLREVHHDT